MYWPVVLVLIGILFLSQRYLFPSRYRLQRIITPSTGPQTFYVSSIAEENGDGSQSHPFKTITKAIDRGISFNASSLKIIVKPGIYDENLYISRNTSIEGQGHPTLKCTITNTQGHNLTLKSLKITEVIGKAITHYDGDLTINDVQVNNTKRIDGDYTSGRALQIIGYNGITNANLENVILNNNEGQAIYIEGNFTKVKINNIEVRGNKTNPNAYEDFDNSNVLKYLGAIEIGYAAKLFMENFTISDNEGISFLVRDGGQTHIRKGMVTKSQTYEELLGFNCVVVDAGKLQAHDFVFSHATVCGIYLDNAYIKLVDGEISNNLIGLSIQEFPDSENYDVWGCIDPSVQFLNNVTRLDSSILPIPSIDPVPPVCPDLVPWE